MGYLWLIPALPLLLFLVVTLRGAPYVPSRRRDVRRAFDDLYAIGANDLLVDIGSGDGSVLREAAKRGARAVGYELNPILVLVSRWLNRKYPGVHVRWSDAWLVDLPEDTTVVYAFSTSRDIEKMGAWLDKQVARLDRPVYFLSYGFTLKRSPIRSHGAFSLYEITPLQPSEEAV